MARHFFTQKNRSKTTPSPQQRIISQYFTPRSGISKDEVNFLVKANPSSQKNKNTHRTTGVLERTDQITFTPAQGFTTATKIYQQSGGCYSGTENQQILSGHRHLGSTTCTCAVSGHVSCTCSALKNSTAEEKQTHFDNTLVLGIMASSASPSSSSSSSSSQSPRNTRSTRRSNSRAQNHIKGRPGSVKKQKRVPETITVDSEDDNCLRDDDCCVITSVSCGRKLKSNSEVEESSSSSQSFTSMEFTCSSQGSKGERSYKSSSSCESDQKNTPSLCKKSSLLSKSVRQTKEQASAKSMFGLVGGSVSDSDDDDDASQDLSQCESDFAQLPVEIMENIFCQLPIVDLMLNCALVCHQWYDIISRDSVMVFLLVLSL